MKFFVFLACAFVLVNAGAESEQAEESLRELSELLKTKFNITIVDDLIKMLEKVDEKCPDIETKLDNAVEQVMTCIEEIDLKTDTFCQIIRKNFITCSKPFRDVAISCLPEESKDLPLLGEKVIAALLDQACNSTVEQILELFNPCVLENDIDDVPQCHSVDNALVHHRNKLPSKALICEMLPKLKGCAKAQLEASCKNPITKNAHIQFYDAVDDATSDSCASLNRT